MVRHKAIIFWIPSLIGFVGLLIAWCFSCLFIDLCAGAGTLPAVAACTPLYHLTPCPAVSHKSMNSLLCLTYSSYSCLPIPLYLLLLFTEKVIDFISDVEAGEWLWVWVQIGLQCKTVSPSSPPLPQEKVGQKGEKETKFVVVETTTTVCKVLMEIVAFDFSSQFVR